MNSFLLSLSLLPGHSPKCAHQNTTIATLGDKSSETLSDMEKAKNSVPPSFPTTHTHTHTLWVRSAFLAIEKAHTLSGAFEQ